MQAEEANHRYPSDLTVNLQTFSYRPPPPHARPGQNKRQLENGFPSDESQGCDREEQGDGGTGRVREKSTVGSLPSFQKRTFKEVTTLGGGDFDDEESDEDMHGNDEDELRKSNAGGGLSFPLHRIDSVGDALRDGAASSPSPNGDQQRALGSEAKLSPPSNERHARFDLQRSVKAAQDCHRSVAAVTETGTVIIATLTASPIQLGRRQVAVAVKWHDLEERYQRTRNVRNPVSGTRHRGGQRRNARQPTNAAVSWRGNEESHRG